MLKIKVIIVDDHAVVRSGLRAVLDAQASITVVGEAADSVSCIQQAMELKPDIVLMDLSFPNGRDGLYTTKELLQSMPEVKVIVLTMHDDEQYLFRALKAGASGYILKSAPLSELVTAIEQVQQGLVYLHPSATKKVIQGYLQGQPKDPKDVFESLTEREKEILSLVAKGYTNKEVAELLLISVKTVENHKANMMDKLQLDNRRELVKLAYRRGLLDID
ncbi:response regulator [Paenibacillus crassostreae]|uniref:Two-component system response regulator n=1 Tax=Paenibacillus crassostreae TaxID=1763538 RepID=A0A167DKC1_9BACL|nr:response regulator transcription factor [Paenibacillus crassostreae]AOZ91353.1 DNA-binding response regulator [Paenibacillus crassostreae]OAB74488.1 two-component system response regulator [Paenibacillus crassostreae]